jgi:hypothetical protein
MINTVMNEWGFRKIDGLLEDGTRIMVLEVPPPPTPTGILVQVI